nr:hypothetical protein Iba_chr09eCG2310 [Ipomoea batatas]
MNFAADQNERSNVPWDGSKKETYEEPEPAIAATTTRETILSHCLFSSIISWNGMKLLWRFQVFTVMAVAVVADFLVSFTHRTAEFSVFAEINFFLVLLTLL